MLTQSPLVRVCQALLFVKKTGTAFPLDLGLSNADFPVLADYGVRCTGMFRLLGCVHSKMLFCPFQLLADTECPILIPPACVSLRTFLKVRPFSPFLFAFYLPPSNSEFAFNKVADNCTFLTGPGLFFPDKDSNLPTYPF